MIASYHFMIAWSLCRGYQLTEDYEARHGPCHIFNCHLCLLSISSSSFGCYKRSLEWSNPGDFFHCLGLGLWSPTRTVGPVDARFCDSVCRGDIALVCFFLTFYPPADVKDKQCVRKDINSFGSELVQMPTSLLIMLPIASLKKKKQCPIYFEDTLDEKKKKKKKEAFAGRESFYCKAKWFLKASETASLILLYGSKSSIVITGITFVRAIVSGWLDRYFAFQAYASEMVVATWQTVKFQQRVEKLLFSLERRREVMIDPYTLSVTCRFSIIWGSPGSKFVRMG